MQRFMSKDQNQMIHFAKKEKKSAKSEFLFLCAWREQALFRSQGLHPHKQSDLFKLSISEFCYLITSGGQHIPLACELWRTFFMSEVDGRSGEELIINPQ